MVTALPAGMYTRRTAVGALVGLCTAALAGCSRLDEALDGETLDEAAEPAAVEASAAAAAGFRQTTLTDRVYERTVEVAGESTGLRLRNWLARYTPVAAADGDPAVFALLTTPTITVAGRSANPFRGFDRERLLRAIVERTDTAPVTGVEAVGERTSTVLGDPVPVDVFRADGTRNGTRLRLQAGDRTHDGDLLVFLCISPASVDATEATDTLAAGITHPVERP